MANYSSSACRLTCKYTSINNLKAYDTSTCSVISGLSGLNGVLPSRSPLSPSPCLLYHPSAALTRSHWTFPRTFLNRCMAVSLSEDFKPSLEFETMSSKISISTWIWIPRTISSVLNFLHASSCLFLTMTGNLLVTLLTT
jgi:hypothetical protein